MTKPDQSKTHYIRASGQSSEVAKLVAFCQRHEAAWKVP
jgi:hypothetical protein